MSQSTTDAPAGAGAGQVGGPRHPITSRARRPGEFAVMWLLRTAAAISVLTTVGIVFILFEEAYRLFQLNDTLSIGQFLTGTEWRPNAPVDSDAFAIGVLPLVAGTLLVTVVAVAVAVPLGIASAAYLAEYAPARVRRTLKPVLEILAGVPTVVLGYFALTFVTPVLRAVFGEDTIFIFNALSAGIVMGVMIVPTIASLSEDAMSSVPQALRDGAFGLGASKRQVVRRVVFPAALSGIVGAVILGIGRAIGETMIVAIAAGNLPNLTWVPFEQIQAMTAYIVQTVQGESPRGSVAYQTLFAVGALLFVMTLTVNLIAQQIVRRFREQY